MSRGRPRGQRGELLIETLITVTLMSVVVLSLLAFMFTVVLASSTHRSTVRSTNEATKVAEAIDGLTYTSCGNPSNPIDYNSALALAPPGHTAQIQSIEFLQDNTSRSSTFGTGCPTGGDQGVQRVTVRVSASSGEGATVQLIKRDQRCTGNLGTQVAVNQPC